jgi:protein-L-isoaspartate(D-aspartate) O-methyltransferase
MLGRRKKSFEELRAKMVDEQLRNRGIRDEAVLSVMAQLPRHLFVTEEYERIAYSDCPIQIDCGQTVSQPYMVGLMTERLEVKAGDRVLEVGTGSGYQTAVLATLGATVYTVERHHRLMDQARRRLEGMGLGTVRFKVGDGTLGWQEEAPFDRILVTAGAPGVPDELKCQLADGGRFVIPVGKRSVQVLTLITREGDSLDERADASCIFVPLIGEEGWPEDV